MTYDMYLAPTEDVGAKPFGFYYSQARKVTGYTKLAQVYLRYLLTPAGSDPSGTVLGTSLPDLMGATVADAGEALVEVTLAVQDALDQVKARPGVLGVDPGLRSASVANFTVDRAGNANFDIRLEAQDGKILTIALPLDNGAVSGLSTAKIQTYGTYVEGL